MRKYTCCLIFTKHKKLANQHVRLLGVANALPCARSTGDTCRKKGERYLDEREACDQLGKRVPFYDRLGC